MRGVEIRGNIRDSFEIMENILDITKRGARKTTIIYGANLNHSRASKYLKDMIDKGLLDFEEEPITYRTTEKGLNFLKKFKEIKEIIGE